MRAAQYPDEYPAMFASALKKPVSLVFSTHAKAVAFRVELYKYRYAVRDELPSQRTLYDNVMKVSMSITNKTLTLSTKKAKFVEKLNDRH